MLYRKIDFRKLYEAMDDQADLENNPGVVMGDKNAPVETAPQAAESFPTPPESNPGENKEAVKVMKGMTYAYPVNQEDYNQLNQLIEAGSGEWNSSTPLKKVSDPNSTATMEIGGQSKPVYLKVILIQTKGERLSTPLNLEDEDRVYVALVTSPSDLKSNLDTAVDITNYVKLTVKTPIMKSGNNIEYSLNMWKNFKSNEETSSENTEASMNDVKQIKSEQPGLAAQLDLPESRKRFVKGKWAQVNEQTGVLQSSQNNDSTKTSTSSKPNFVPFLSPEAKAKADASTKTSTSSKPIVINDISKVEAGTVLKLGRTGKAVEEIQTMLGITSDGKFGPQTKEAIKKFQQENGLKVDGIVGKNTLTALRKKKSDATAEAEAKAKEAAKPEVKNKAEETATKAAEAQPKTENKNLEDMSVKELKDELNKSKNNLKAARQEARQEKRSDRQDRREARKDARQDRREDSQEERLRRKVEKIQKKIEKATNESKIYNFDEFVKIVHGFQSE